jgi:hypothetical protein
MARRETICGVEGWLELAQYHNQGRTFELAMLNLWVVLQMCSFVCYYCLK